MRLGHSAVEAGGEGVERVLGGARPLPGGRRPRRCRRRRARRRRWPRRVCRGWRAPVRRAPWSPGGGARSRRCRGHGGRTPVGPCRRGVASSVPRSLSDCCRGFRPTWRSRRGGGRQIRHGAASSRRRLSWRHRRARPAAWQDLGERPRNGPDPPPARRRAGGTGNRGSTSRRATTPRRGASRWSTLPRPWRWGPDTWPSTCPFSRSGTTTRRATAWQPRLTSM